MDPDLVVVKLEGERESEVWCGTFMHAAPARGSKHKWQLHVDQFRLIGVHSHDKVSEVDFFGGISVGQSMYVPNDRYQPSGDDQNPPNADATALAKVRRGQQKFKAKLMHIWRRRCAITRCAVRPALVGAHIEAYAIGGSYAPSNGLLLRADIHALYDSGLLSVDQQGRVHLSDAIKDPAYRKLAGCKLHLAREKWPKALDKSLAIRHADFLAKAKVR